MTLLPLHVTAGAIAIASGFVALYALKGEKLHREIGTIFVYAMVIMAGSGAARAATKAHGWGTALGGVLASYLVITGLLTIRRRTLGFDSISLGAMLVALTLGITYLTFALEALYSATGKKDGYPPPLYFIFGTVTLLAAFG